MQSACIPDLPSLIVQDCVLCVGCTSTPVHGCCCQILGRPLDGCPDPGMGAREDGVNPGIPLPPAVTPC